MSTSIGVPLLLLLLLLLWVTFDIAVVAVEFMLGKAPAGDEFLMDVVAEDRLVGWPNSMKVVVYYCLGISNSLSQHASMQLKVAFFRKCNSFFKSPNIQNKNIPNYHPELEI